MTATKWTIDSDQSDVLIKTRHSIIAYLVSKSNSFNGSISVVNDELHDANVEFIFDINTKGGKLEQFDTNLKLNDFIDTIQNPTISFKSTSFQKVNSNINFLKGNLTINNITKVVELDVVLTGLETQDGIVLGQDMNLTANLEFNTHTSFN